MKPAPAFTNFLLLLAIPAAIFLPKIGSVFTPYTAWILGGMLFFSFLGLPLSQLASAVRHPAKPFFVSMVVLVITPLIAYPVMQRFFPEYLLGALLFMLVPTAVSAPAVAALHGGNIATATVNTVFTNLLSPLTIPLFLKLFVGSSIDIPASKILIQMLFIIVIPFTAGLLINRQFLPTVERFKPFFRPVNLSLLFLLFFAVLSPHATAMVANLTNIRLLAAVLTAHLVLYFFAHLTAFQSSDKSEKISLKASILFLNAGLAVVLAQNYFSLDEMLFLIFCQIFWVLLFALFKYLK